MRWTVRVTPFEPVEFARQVEALPAGEKADRYRKWLPAGAAGAIQEATSILSLPKGHTWHVCGGAFPYPDDSGPNFHIMCFEGTVELMQWSDQAGTQEWEIGPRPERVQDRTWHIFEEAQQVMRLFNSAMYTHWLRDGGFDGEKYLVPAWLVPKELPCV